MKVTQEEQIIALQKDFNERMSQLERNVDHANRLSEGVGQRRSPASSPHQRTRPTLSQDRHLEVGAFADAGRPPRSNGLQTSVKANPLGSVHVVVPKQ
jgi:hypothetical protein